MLAFAADNANVMVGSKNSIASLLQNEIPNLFIMRCTCHSLARCATAAANKLPREVEEILRKVYLYFKHSANRQHNFELVQRVLHLKILKILKIADIRWLSLNTCMQSFLDLLPALRKYFEEELAPLKNAFKLSKKQMELRTTIESIY